MLNSEISEKTRVSGIVETHATRFNKSNAAVYGKHGGIKSGEVRRRKAANRSWLRSITADIVYSEFLEHVTEDELRGFIRWRGQQKRKATLAQQKLDDIESGDDEEVHECTAMLIERTLFYVNAGRFRRRSPVRNLFLLPFKEAVARSGNYDDIMYILSTCIEKAARILYF